MLLLTPGVSSRAMDYTQTERLTHLSPGLTLTGAGRAPQRYLQLKEMVDSRTPRNLTSGYSPVDSRPSCQSQEHCSHREPAWPREAPRGVRRAFRPAPTFRPATCLSCAAPDVWACLSSLLSPAGRSPFLTSFVPDIAEEVKVSPRDREIEMVS